MTEQAGYVLVNGYSRLCTWVLGAGVYGGAVCRAVLLSPALTQGKTVAVLSHCPPRPTQASQKLPCSVATQNCFLAPVLESGQLVNKADELPPLKEHTF